MYKVLKQEGRAKRGELTTVHGVVQTPVFMNVGTVAAIKGAVSTEDLEGIGTQIELSNTYHLHVRPGDEIVKKMGGLHKFMSWNKPILTDSGGFQVFSLASMRKIREVPISTDIRFLWDRRKVCGSSPIWHLPLPWHLMNVLLHWQRKPMCRILWTEPTDGWYDAGRR